MSNIVSIDCFATSPKSYDNAHAVVAIDVIRATTTAITAVTLGRSCYPVVSVDAALALSRKLDRALLAGELGGIMPGGFHLNNSPAAIAERSDVMRPLILLSSSGTKLLWSSRNADVVHLACFRNAAAVARSIAGRHERITIIGAGSRGEFREEDQICAAWIAADLMDDGYLPGDALTAGVVERWGAAPASACVRGKSASYLRRSGQERDLDFVLEHVNDLDEVFVFDEGEVIRIEQECALEIVA
jgi:2-phosphosulfolactate phosphatase